MSLRELQQKAKNVVFLPSQMPIEGYVRVKRRCVCCGHWKVIGEIRKEDAEKIAESDKPLCKRCANFLRKWNDKWKRKLQQLFDTIPLDYQKIKEGFWEFYVLGTRIEWIKWFEKFGEVLKGES